MGYEVQLIIILSSPSSQASKTDMDVMKCLGVVSMKAGRTLLYKVADVVTMFTHWKLAVPFFIREMARGKVCEWVWPCVCST